MAGKEEMTVPFILGLVAGIFVLIVNVFVTIAGAAIPLLGGMLAAVGIWGIIDGILLIVGSILMRNPAQAKIGSILVLIFGILAFFTAGFGFIVFPILAIVGGALGISKSK